MLGEFISGLANLYTPVTSVESGKKEIAKAMPKAITAALIGFFKNLLSRFCQESMGAKISAIKIEQILKKLGKKTNPNIKSMSVKIQNNVFE